jgi:dienelactone hydrolase
VRDPSGFPRILLTGLLLGVAPAGCELPFHSGTDGLEDEILERRGVLVSVEETGETVEEGARLVDLRLRSSSGLEVQARARIPQQAGPASRLPGVVLTTGRVTGRDAVEYLPPAVQVVAISPDFPKILQPGEGGERVEERTALEAAARDVPAMLMLLADWLEDRQDVESDRLVLIGVSFGGFFAPLTAAMDPRFRNVALLYTGAHLHSLVATNLDGRLPSPARHLGAELVTLPFQSLEPARWAGRISPRPVLVVNGLYDHQIPVANAQALVDALGPPKDVVWLPTGHLRAADILLVEEVVDTSFVRLPLLAGSR